jgi:BirA family biotin operon repressor/biotin-[acetyl-CoA-carboxylase] ligase
MAAEGLQRRLALVQALTDGAWHSGETIAEAMGVSRTAVWKHAAHLTDWGLALESAAGQGYRLAQPLSLLDAAALHAALDAPAREAVRHVEVHAELASTNAHLLAVNTLAPGQFDVCLAEYQTAGRGRRGRAWQSPFAAGLCFSLSWAFSTLPPGLGALSLATGVAVRRTLARFGLAAPVQLKWPNDLVVIDQKTTPKNIHATTHKLGGILLELRAEAGGPAYIVLGIGLNVQVPAATREAVAATGLQLTDLAALADVLPSRTALAAALASELHAMLVQFTAEGFAPFHAEWSAVDALAGCEVRWLEGERERTGTACGIALDGALQVRTAQGQVEPVYAGEVLQMRAQP